VEGRAGMAAIVDVNHKVDLDQLYKDLQKSLPSYARPVFIRLLEKVDVTGESHFLLYIALYYHASL
jgi:solute carrier family 27 fatty acid transporter 1/4